MVLESCIRVMMSVTSKLRFTPEVGVLPGRETYIHTNIYDMCIYKMPLKIIKAPLEICRACPIVRHDFFIVWGE